MYTAKAFELLIMRANTEKMLIVKDYLQGRILGLNSLESFGFKCLIGSNSFVWVGAINKLHMTC